MNHPLEAPTVEGMTILGLLGSGTSGRVFIATDAAGELLAVKVFDSLAIQRPLLARMTARLEAGGWPQGILPVVNSQLDRRPALRITPCLADSEESGTWKPRCLQHRLDEFPGPASWPLIRELATALAGMHAKQVAHGNLKPGNLFFNHTGELMIADWALGNMPGIGHLEFTDAFLYQPPEQLRHPAGYTEEAGYRWDVFAFGVIAFRLLTGSFPRCNDTFPLVAPPPGKTRREGIQADLPRIAQNLEASPDVHWPSETSDPLEAGLRAWVLRCLSLDPHLRPASMTDVLAGFATVEAKVAADQEREHLLDQLRHSKRWILRSAIATGAATLVAAAFISHTLWQKESSRFKLQETTWKLQATALESSVNQATSRRDAALAEAREAREALNYERELAISRLQESRLIADQLFSWAMEKGHRSLPPLDGRELRLKRLERYFEDFLARTAAIPELAEEHSRIRLQLAEISLANGDPETAKKRLETAIDTTTEANRDADWNMRIATNRLLLALLLQARNDENTAASFFSAREALSNVPAARTDADRLSQLLAILDFHEAKLLASRGEDAQALAQLMRATQALNHLADQRPDSIIPRTELAACYLASATVLEGIGKLGDASEARLLATGEMLKLHQADPTNPQIRLELAGCHGANAEAAVLAGDIGNAEKQSAEAMKLLITLLREQPDNAEAASRLAAQYGLRAGLMQDRGQAADALKSYDEGIRLLEGIRAARPDNATAAYRLALLWWQKGRAIGFSGDRKQEISLITRARELLELLESKPRPEGPPDEQLQRSNAYLLGDLGHAQQLAGDKPTAAATFKLATQLWERLLQARPKNQEYSEALEWCRQRAKELEPS